MTDDVSKLTAYVVVSPVVQESVSKLTPYVVLGPDADEMEAGKLVAYVVIGPPPTVDLRKMLTWTFTLDDHDYLVIQLFDSTLVYDFFSQRWYSWGSGDGALWNPQHGQNWNANLGAILSGLGGERVSNAICGDGQTSALYFLDPGLNEDYSPDGVAGVPFMRAITGQLVSRSQDFTPLYGVEVTASDGDTVDASNLTVRLSYSDDAGHTYKSAGDKTVVLGEYSSALQWRSLGSYKAPGRLLRLVDYGALVRVDDWTIPDDDTKHG